MDRVLVVGSGASGVHFALSLLRAGREVTMIDVGRRRPAPILPDASLNRLKADLADPVAYFYGPDFGNVLLPGAGREYYGIPESKSFVFDAPDGFGFASEGFAPLFSFAQGGLAEVWTGGCYPFDDGDLREFPFRYADLAPCYEEIAERIGITGVDDDLASDLPFHAGLLPPLDLDEHSRALLDAYARRRARVAGLGCRVGRTRVAALSAPRGRRQACSYLGRCLWGCPTDAFYTPVLTLEECRSDPRFTYVDGMEVLYFKAGDGGRIATLVARREADGVEQEFGLDRLVLAAGTLGSARIVLESMRQAGDRTPALRGLMDNRQVLVPFLNLRMLGRRFADESYQYHQLGLMLDARDPRDRVFGLVTTLKTALIHPIAQSLPVDLRSALDIARTCHAALGLVNLNFRDTRREGNTVALEDVETHDGGRPRLYVRYAAEGGESARLDEALGRLRRVLRTLGCIVPPGMAHVRPMGASVHYAGLLPMAAAAEAGTTTPECRSRDFPNLWLVDGSVLPFLPAKNVTFTLMANAVRVARAEF